MLPVRKGNPQIAARVGAYAHIRGHPIYWHSDDVSWRYADGVLASRGLFLRAGDGSVAMEDRPCTLCGRKAVNVGGKYPDPCMGLLPDVAQACCGHGVQRAYVAWAGAELLTVGERLTTAPRDSIGLSK